MERVYAPSNPPFTVATLQRHHRFTIEAFQAMVECEILPVRGIDLIDGRITEPGLELTVNELRPPV